MDVQFLLPAIPKKHPRAANPGSFQGKKREKIGIGMMSCSDFCGCSWSWEVGHKAPESGCWFCDYLEWGELIKNQTRKRQLCGLKLKRRGLRD